ncbi:MAG: hypoxanthine phosphoribosyltransferase [Simkaniaceae bacterium]|nr:MAG: hypoxanthine phosphoribosyltransferase [Simkaniaceae bacterium]
MQKKQPPGKELQLQLLIDADQIEERLERVARQLEKNYDAQELTIVMIMKGSFILIADLMRHLHLPVRLDPIYCSSYGNGRKGELTVEGIDGLEIQGKNILVVDDIFDTGETLAEVVSQIEKKNPASLKSLVLLSKDVPHNTDYRPDFALFDIEDRFVVGYGLDYKEYYRGLPDIYAIEM